MIPVGWVNQEVAVQMRQELHLFAARMDDNPFLAECIKMPGNHFVHRPNRRPMTLDDFSSCPTPTATSETTTRGVRRVLA